MGDRRPTISHMAKKVGVSPERVENILYKKLDMSKFFCSMDATYGAMALDARSKAHQNRHVTSELLFLPQHEKKF